MFVYRGYDGNLSVERLTKVMIGANPRALGWVKAWETI